VTRGGWQTDGKRQRYWSIGLQRDSAILARVVAAFPGEPAGRRIAAAIERALNAAGAPLVKVPKPRRCAARRVHGGRCTGQAAPGSTRCPRHWPGRYPLDTRR
jgi:hypothetical protein